jgi:membrane protein required for colicin V production
VRVNWVDCAVFAVLGVSTLLAFLRGLVREVLGIAAWVGAGFFAAWAAPLVRGRFRAWTGSPDVGDPVALATMFLLAVIFLSIITGMIGGLVRASALSGVDRTLGVVFGLLRGAALVAFAYIAGGIIGVAHWPPAVLEARTLPYAYEGAVLAVGLLPAEYRPSVQPPPKRRETRAEDLLRANPQGRAIGRP